MTREQYDRLRELEELDADGVPLSVEEYAELRELLVAENAAFVNGAA